VDTDMSAVCNEISDKRGSVNTGIYQTFITRVL
jgi:hypothetical protein